MSRRLSEMTEDMVDTGGKSAARIVETAGFSEDLRKQLEERVAGKSFRHENQRALLEHEMPVCSRTTYLT